MTVDIHAADLVAALRERMDGPVFGPEDEGFSIARKLVVSGLEETLPALVARCTGTADVATALAFAVERELPFAVRSGGHSFAEYSSTPGLLIDLGLMAWIEPDPDRGLVRVGPGALVGWVAQVLAGSKLMVPLGWCPTVGVAGSVLGGGFGPMSRLYGLATDHLAAADVVLPDQRVVMADERNEPDLFWALRGAGAGNFGVVTDLTLRTRPALDLTRFTYRWPIEHAVAVVDGWQRYAPHAPDEVTIELVVSSAGGPDGAPACLVFGAVAGGVEQAIAHGEELIDAIGPRPERDEPVELVWLSAYDAPKYHSFAGAVSGMLRPQTDRAAGDLPVTRFVRSDFFEGPVPESAISALVESLTEPATVPMYGEVEFVPWGGAIGRTGQDTAFGHRDPTMLVESSVLGRVEAEDRQVLLDRARRTRDTLRPWATGRIYQNYPDPDLTDWAEAYYGDALPRLREVKRTYDPDNRFRYAQSISLTP